MNRRPSNINVGWRTACQCSMKKRIVGGTITVALVEDDPGVRANLANMIDGAPGFHCQAAYADGPAALKDIPTNRPDVVLMDINLPGIDGIETTRRIRALETGVRVPIIAITSYALAGDRERFLAAGCNGYVEKPIDPMTLVEDLHRIMKKGEVKP